MSAVDPPRELQRKASAAFILFTISLDMLAVGMILPVLPNLIGEFTRGRTSETAQILGLFGSAFAGIQFLCSPLLGALSDRFSKRPVVLLSNVRTRVPQQGSREAHVRASSLTMLFRYDAAALMNPPTCNGRLVRRRKPRIGGNSHMLQEWGENEPHRTVADVLVESMAAGFAVLVTLAQVCCLMQTIIAGFRS